MANVIHGTARNPFSRPKLICERVHAGCYRYSYDGRSVRVEDRDPNPDYGDTKRMWMAIAEWDDNNYSDPVASKAVAKGYALAMLKYEA